MSLFSAGGIGDLGFKNAGFRCLATAELISRRLEVQTLNKISEEAGYICGDINDERVFQSILRNCEKFERKNSQPVTAVLATPPCQGMSVANQKKGDELQRNSLVVRSIEIIQRIKPLVFVFENVPAFIKTTCTGLDGDNRPIGEEIERVLGGEYEFFSKVLQLAECGSPSSRKRSITIGVRNDLTWVTPLDLFPPKQPAMSLRELIGDLPRLTEMGQWALGDPFHAFRPYKPHMRDWISELKEGESAFDNLDPRKRPHRIIDGKVVPNVRKNGDKYKRVYWDAIPPCVHTRNDILASQNTVHPQDDRVFSIRELMRMMGVPDGFRWFEIPSEASEEDVAGLIAKHAMNIRQCLGEAVPVPVTEAIANAIRLNLVSHMYIRGGKPRLLNNSNWTTDAQQRAYAVVPSSTAKNFAAYYTQPLVAFAVAKRALGSLGNKASYRILEPSVGSGVFVAVLRQLLVGKNWELVVIDSDTEAIERFENGFRIQNPLGNNEAKLETFCGDYLSFPALGGFDLIIGNPPFGIKGSGATGLGKRADISARFVSKARSESSVVAFVLPKATLHADRYKSIRDEVGRNDAITSVLDLGELAFPSVKVETVGLVILPRSAVQDVEVKSWVSNEVLLQEQDYICPQEFPTWMIYRNDCVDEILTTCEAGKLSVSRDRRISRRMAVAKEEKDSVRVFRGRNLSKDGSLIDDSRDYWIARVDAEQTLAAIASLESNVTLLAPNLSYYPRLVQYEVTDEAVPDGSCAVMYGNLTEKEIRAAIKFSSTEKNKEFYRIACNRATRSINIDNSLSFWWLVPKCEHED